MSRDQQHDQIELSYSIFGQKCLLGSFTECFSDAAPLSDYQEYRYLLD